MSVTRETPFLSPDRLKQVLYALQRVESNHTSKIQGYKHANGTQYVGNVCNFGSEVFLESRKLLMDHPPIFENVKFADVFRYYFDFHYSGFVESYEQQNMIVALLQRDVILSPRYTYTLTFTEGNIETILRSPNSSTYTVERQRFYHTTTPPILKITDTVDSSYEEYELNVVGKVGSQTDFYFSMNGATSGLYTYQNQTVTIPITKSMEQIPLVWVCNSDLHIYPDMNLTNNIDQYGNPLLKHGVNGHDLHMLYPSVYQNNVPTDTTGLTGSWFIKVHTENGFDQTDATRQRVNCIEYVFGTDIGHPATKESVLLSFKLEYDASYTEIYLVNHIAWQYRKPASGEYDDTPELRDKYYAYTPFQTFADNHDGTKPLLLYAFTIRFNTLYMATHEHLQKNAYVGIHMDASSELTDHSIYKKNGLVHQLGEFDGLPDYFHYLLSDTIHHIHGEIYSIRENPNIPNEKITNKQTAALILDSAIIESEYKKISSNLKTSIPYVDQVTGYDQPGFEYDPSMSTSSVNYLSAVVYVNDQEFATYIPTDKTYEDYPRFIYHGDMLFSLSEIGYDPLTQIGRVYVISNDHAIYENNEQARFPKPKRTFARICDIPTTFEQLMHISGKAPTLVIDSKYLRIHSNYTLENVFKILYDQNTAYVKNDTYSIFPDNIDLDLTIGTDYLMSHNEYRTITNINSKIPMDLSITPITYEVGTAGSGYVIGDEFSFAICGIAFKGTITEVSNSAVSAFELTEEEFENVEIPVSNFDGSSTAVTTSTTKGIGTGLTLSLTIENYDDYLRTVSDIREDLFTLKLDQFGFLWIWKYDTNEQSWIQYAQLTGDLDVVFNQYDDQTQIDVFRRKTVDVVMRNLLQTDLSYQGTEYTREWNYITQNEDPLYDYSEALIQEGLNFQHAYYVTHDGTTVGHEGVDIRVLNDRERTRLSEMKDVSLLPRFHNLPFYYYQNHMIQYDFSKPQPDPYYYNSSKSKIGISETVVTSTTHTISNYRDWLISDEIDSKYTYTDAHGQTMLTEDVYESSMNHTTEEDHAYRTSLLEMTHQELIQSIQDTYGDTEPVLLEGTANAYTDDMLVEYLYLNHRMGNHTAYKNQSIKRIRMHGDMISTNYHTQKNGDQFVGGMERMTQKNFITSAKYHTLDTTVYPDFVFRIDNPELTDLTGFRMYDAEGNDISAYVTLILNQQLYRFDATHSVWVAKS